jgi:hypothetical protein
MLSIEKTIFDERFTDKFIKILRNSVPHIKAFASETGQFLGDSDLPAMLGPCHLLVVLFKQFQNRTYWIGPMRHHIVIHENFRPFSFLETELRQLRLKVLFFFRVFLFWNVTLAETHLLFVKLFVDLVEVVYV